MSDTRRSPFTEAALERVLDNNLSAKYSLTGLLKPDNIINDGFYDLGKVMQESLFLCATQFHRFQIFRIVISEKSL